MIDRCNLTVLLLAAQRRTRRNSWPSTEVEVVASLPYYRQQNTDAQRGEGVFEQSIEALRRLNALGYGRAGSGLRPDR